MSSERYRCVCTNFQGEHDDACVKENDWEPVPTPAPAAADETEILLNLRAWADDLAYRILGNDLPALKHYAPLLFNALCSVRTKAWREREAELKAPAPAADLAKNVTIEIFQHDWLPGFAAFRDDGSLSESGKAHVVLNLGSLLAAIHISDLDRADLPYLIAETLMHEVIHVLESWAGVEFSEERVESLLAQYRDKYQRATVWKYTGEEPK